MLLYKAISLRSLIAKEMSQDFSQNIQIACTHPCKHTQRKQTKKKEIVTVSLKAIMYPINHIFFCYHFHSNSNGRLFCRRAIVLGIYKWSRQLADRFKQLELVFEFLRGKEVLTMKCLLSKEKYRVVYLTYQNSLHY
ncbi:hypothetical protein HJG60_008512 [Phyllostomus discolor]|uniref:Uncharacterized protein n=1 Tax=Phyllostomus discolor TaxID=89673 RepID=A0A834DQI6_9CHIR|nr:hypothetical protein HJG60_008512 [Phyllostomus discolor]